VEKINEYLGEKLNVSIKLVENEWGSHDQKMKLIIGSGEKYDLCWTSSWCNNFRGNISMNAYLAIEDLYTQYAPDLQKIMPDYGITACTVNGHLYGIPSMQIWAQQNGFMYSVDVVNEYGFDMDSVKQVSDLEPLFEKIKADHSDAYPFAVPAEEDIWGRFMYNIENGVGVVFLNGTVVAALRLDDDTHTVINPYTLPEVKDAYDMAYAWSQKGYIAPFGYTTDETPDKYSCIVYKGTMKPGEDVVSSQTYGFEVSSHATSDLWVSVSRMQATVNSISVTSEHPDKAMQFLNLLNTDPYLYNLFANGIEGKHYERIDDTYIRSIEGSGYFPNSDWMYGNQFIAYLHEGMEPTVWEEMQQMNVDAKPTPDMGFQFDPANVQTEVANVQAVVSEYTLQLGHGASDPAKLLPEFLEKLESAGSAKIIEDAQTQLDAWLAAQ